MDTFDYLYPRVQSPWTFQLCEPGYLFFREWGKARLKCDLELMVQSQRCFNIYLFFKYSFLGLSTHLLCTPHAYLLPILLDLYFTITPPTLSLTLPLVLMYRIIFFAFPLVLSIEKLHWAILSQVMLRNIPSSLIES